MIETQSAIGRCSMIFLNFDPMNFDPREWSSSLNRFLKFNHGGRVQWLGAGRPAKELESLATRW